MSISNSNNDRTVSTRGDHRSNFWNDDRLWDPVSDFRSLSRHWNNRNAPSSFSIDVLEAPDHYTIKAAIPGVKKEDVRIELDQDTNGQNYLLLQAEKKHAVTQETKDHRTVYAESSYGAVSRRIPLPEDVSLDKGVDARMEHGELRLNVPRTQNQNRNIRKQITIQ